MMLPQPGGNALYLSQPLHSAAAASTYPHLSQQQQQQITAAFQQPQYQSQGGVTSSLPSLGGQLTPVTANVTSAQSNSNAAVMAAAAALAAAVQWPQHVAPTNGNQQTTQHLATGPLQGMGQAGAGPQAIAPNSAISPQQAAVVAAAVAAQQQANWRWSPSVQQTQIPHATSASHISANGMTTTVSSTLGGTTSTPSAVHNQALQAQQQVSDSGLSLIPTPVAALQSATRIDSPILNASTAALLAAAALQNPIMNLFGAASTGAFDLTSAGALNALVSDTTNAPAMMTSNSSYLPEKGLQEECHTNATSCVDVSLNAPVECSDVQPSKKPRYDEPNHLRETNMAVMVDSEPAISTFSCPNA